MGERGFRPPEAAAEKKPRSGNRVEGKTKIFVSEKGGPGDFVNSEKLKETVEGILAEAAAKLKPEVVANIKIQFERAVVRGLRTIAEKKNEEPGYDVSVAKGSFYSAKVEMLKNLVENAITNSNSPDKEDRLIPELKTRKNMSDTFEDLVQGLTQEEKLVLASLDLDGFKKINDTLGHETGDKVLRSFGISLFKAPRPDDAIAHYSGDEFGILLKVHAENGKVREIVERILARAQDDPDRPIAGTQDVSTGFVEVRAGDVETVDFATARDRADQAAEVSKSLDILLQMRGTKVDSSKRVVEYEKIGEIKAEYPEEEWQIANKVRGLKREFEAELSIPQMAEITRMIQRGELQQILKDRDIE